MAIETRELAGANRSDAQANVPMELLVLAADIVQLVFVGIVLDWLLFGGVEILWPIRLGVIAAVLVGMLKSHGWLVLLAVQVSLLSREPGRSEMIMGIVPWLFSLTAICIVAYAYLGKSFRTGFSKWMVRQVLFTLGLDDQSQDLQVHSTHSASEATSANLGQFIIAQLIIWMFSIFVAMLALLRLPISSTVRSEWFRNAIENDFVVWPGATLLVFTLLLVVVFMETGWRQMTDAQAKLYLRASFVLAHYRDLRMIVLRQMKARRKQASNSVPQKQLVERT